MADLIEHFEQNLHNGQKTEKKTEKKSEKKSEKKTFKKVSTDFSIQSQDFNGTSTETYSGTRNIRCMGLNPVEDKNKARCYGTVSKIAREKGITTCPCGMTAGEHRHIDNFFKEEDDKGSRFHFYKRMITLKLPKECDKLEQHKPHNTTHHCECGHKAYHVEHTRVVKLCACKNMKPHAPHSEKK